MGGAHRGPGGDSIPRSLGALAALVLVPAAVIAGLIWFFSNATDLELSAFVLIFATAALFKGLVQGKLDMILASLSGVVGFGWEVIRDVTHQPGGSLVEYLVRAVALACASIALIPTMRGGGLGRAWRIIRARLAPGSGGDGPVSPG